MKARIWIIVMTAALIAGSFPAGATHDQDGSAGVQREAWVSRTTGDRTVSVRLAVFDGVYDEGVPPAAGTKQPDRWGVCIGFEKGWYTPVPNAFFGAACGLLVPMIDPALATASASGSMSGWMVRYKRIASCGGFSHEFASYVKGTFAFSVQLVGSGPYVPRAAGFSVTLIRDPKHAENVSIDVGPYLTDPQSFDPSRPEASLRGYGGASFHEGDPYWDPHHSARFGAGVSRGATVAGGTVTIPGQGTTSLTAGSALLLESIGASESVHA